MHVQIKNTNKDIQNDPEFGEVGGRGGSCKSGRGLEWNEPCKAVGRDPSSNLISQTVATKLI